MVKGYRAEHGGMLQPTKDSSEYRFVGDPPKEELIEITSTHLILHFKKEMTVDEALEYTNVPYGDLILKEQ